MNIKMTIRPGGLLFAMVVAIGALGSGTALAGNAPPATLNQTAAGTNVTNSASVDYDVGGIDQPDITSNTDDFEVDRRIDVFVTEVSAAEHDVTPGQSTFATASALSFWVTNLGNDTQDIAVTAANRADGTDDDFTLTGTDLFDVTAPFIYYRDGGNGTYDNGGGDDVLLLIEGGQSYLDQVAKDTTIQVWVVPTSIPTTVGDADATNGNFAVVSLTAVVFTTGTGAADLGVAETNDGGADVAGSVQNVFADAAGEYDAATDGQHSDDDVYQIATAEISITKSSVVVSDPINGTGANRKRIPGAVIRYTITVANAATASATADPVIISDTITSSDVTYATGTLYRSTDATCNTSDTLLTDATDGDRGHISGATITFGDSTGVDESLAPNTSVSYCYDVTID